MTGRASSFRSVGSSARTATGVAARAFTTDGVYILPGGAHHPGVYFRSKLAGAALAVALTGPGCLFYRAVTPDPAPFLGSVTADIAYRPSAGDDDGRRLDLYLPRSPGPHPVVVFVHGGFWVTGGRKAAFGVYQRIGRRLAQQGIVGVVISYRLAPKYSHPAQIEDVASAVAGTLHNIDRYGGDPSRVFVVGHSAGAHLVSLLALDAKWLARHGERPSRIAGVLAISGIYDLEDLATSPAGGLRVPQVFGTDDSKWPAASPISHVKRSAPPFIVAVGADDYPVVIRETQAMNDRLRAAGARLEVVEVSGRSHEAMVVDLLGPNDPVGAQLLKLIASSDER